MTSFPFLSLREPVRSLRPDSTGSQNRFLLTQEVLSWLILENFINKGTEESFNSRLAPESKKGGEVVKFNWNAKGRRRRVGSVCTITCTHDDPPPPSPGTVIETLCRRDTRDKVSGGMGGTVSSPLPPSFVRPIVSRPGPSFQRIDAMERWSPTGVMSRGASVPPPLPSRRTLSWYLANT